MEEHKQAFSRIQRTKEQEKVLRYSIRKYGFGAASVAVAALYLFMGKGAVYAQEPAGARSDTPAARQAGPTEAEDTEGEETDAQVEATLNQLIQAITEQKEAFLAGIEADQQASVEEKKATADYVKEWAKESIASLEAAYQAGMTSEELTKEFEKLVDSLIPETEEEGTTNPAEGEKENTPTPTPMPAPTKPAESSTDDKKPEAENPTDESQPGNETKPVDETKPSDDSDEEKEESPEERQAADEALQAARATINQLIEAKLKAVQADKDLSKDAKKEQEAVFQKLATSAQEDLDEVYENGGTAEEILATATKLAETIADTSIKPAKSEEQPKEESPAKPSDESKPSEENQPGNETKPTDDSDEEKEESPEERQAAEEALQAARATIDQLIEAKLKAVQADKDLGADAKKEQEAIFQKMATSAQEELDEVYENGGTAEEILEVAKKLAETIADTPIKSAKSEEQPKEEAPAKPSNETKPSDENQAGNETKPSDESKPGNETKPTDGKQEESPKIDKVASLKAAVKEAQAKKVKEIQAASHLSADKQKALETVLDSLVSEILTTLEQVPVDELTDENSAELLKLVTDFKIPEKVAESGSSEEKPSAETKPSAGKEEETPKVDTPADGKQPEPEKPIDESKPSAGKEEEPGKVDAPADGKKPESEKPSAETKPSAGKEEEPSKVDTPADGKQPESEKPSAETKPSAGKEEEPGKVDTPADGKQPESEKPSAEPKPSTGKEEEPGKVDAPADGKQPESEKPSAETKPSAGKEEEPGKVDTPADGKQPESEKPSAETNPSAGKEEEPGKVDTPADGKKPEANQPTNATKPTNQSSETEQTLILEDKLSHARVEGTKAELAGVDRLAVRKVQTAVLEGRDYDAFDIELLDKDGKPVHIDKLVKVTLPVQKEVAGVFYIDEEQKLHQLTFTQNGDTVSFTTNHFSIYAIVYKASQAPSKQSLSSQKATHPTKETDMPQVDSQDKKKEDKKELPNTGDTVPSVTFLVGLALALISLTGLKRKEN